MADRNDRGADDRRDELLAIRCQMGEPAAFDDLVERWHEPLWLYARRMAGEDEAAGEAVQDIWIRVLRALPRLREPSRLRPWLFGIARRALMDRLRRQYSTPVHEDLETGLAGTVEPEAGDPDERLELMLDELQQLPITEREVLVLFYLDELSLAQVAELLDVPVGTVKSRLFRARATLRARVDQRIEP